MFTVLRREKYPSTTNGQNQQESPPKFILKVKTSIKPQKDKNMVVATKFKLGSRLCAGKVLAPRTPVVSNENCLVSFANISVSLRYFWFLLFITMYLQKGKNSFLLECLTRFWILLLHIPRCDGELKAM